MAALAATAAPGGDGAASAAGASQDVDDDAPEIDNYVVAAAASVDELMSKDADDVELAAYKAKLLGLGAGGAPVQDDDAKHVAVIELRLHFEDRDAPLIIPLSEESGGAEGGVATGAGGEPPVIARVRKPERFSWWGVEWVVEWDDSFSRVLHAVPIYPWEDL